MTDSGCEDTVPSMAPSDSECKLPEESDATMRARLFNSLSQSFPHSQLYKALHGGEDIILNNGDNSDDDDDSLYGDHLSNSCFATLRMEPRDSDDLDDDLCSLEWLQNEDLLKNIGGSKLDTDDEDQKENEDVKPDLNLLQNGLAGGQPQPHFPYHPQKHVNSKPPYSFSCLIFMAVENSPRKMLPVKDIYNWILTQFPYFQNAPTGWKNSVRHNLSLNKCFKKVEKDKGQSIGKGSLWCIDPAYRPNLLQALRKTPYHPYHQLQMTSTLPSNYLQFHSLPGGGRAILPLTQRPIPNTVSPHLFPFLSRRLAQTSFDVDSEMKDVAQTLVALKAAVKKESPDNSPGEDIGPTWKHHKRSYSYNNRKKRPSSPVVVTDHPYSDHAYSSTRLLDDDDDDSSRSSSSSIDEEYDFGDADEGESDFQSDVWDSDDDKDEVDGDYPPSKRLKIDLKRRSATSVKKEIVDDDDEEQKKLHDGANALLNLAGLLLSNRPKDCEIPSTVASPNGKKRKQSSPEKKKTPKKIVKKKKKKIVKTVATKKVEQKSAEKIPRKMLMSKSKRKNAGSNAKYDSDEYALGMPTKGSNSRGSSKSPTDKSSSSPVKSKSSSSTPNNTAKIRKPTSAKRKLKLSKSFGSKKPSAAASSKGEGAFASKKDKKRISDIKGQSVVKKPKCNTVGSEKSKEKSKVSKDIRGDVVDSLSKFSHKKSDFSKAVEIDVPPNNNNNNDVTKDSRDPNSGEGLTPAGDAPTAMSVSSAHSEDASCELSELNSGGGDEDRKIDTASKASGDNNNHKSPHFTRFSKKKSVIS